MGRNLQISTDIWLQTLNDLHVISGDFYNKPKNLLKIKTHQVNDRLMPTCSDVKATSLGTDDIPFSFTSGNILKRASSMAYMLEIAPPRGQTGRCGVTQTSQTPLWEEGGGRRLKFLRSEHG